MHKLLAGRSGSRLIIAAIAVVAAGSVASADQTYKVVLDRTVKVGQEFLVTCKTNVDQSAKITVNGQVQNHDSKYLAEMTATQKVEAVNEKVGGATKVTVTVDSVTKDGNELFPKGTVITADTSGGKESFTVDGADVGPEKSEVLSKLIELASTDEALTQDQMFGTAKPQAVGATWDGDSDKIAKMLDGEQIPVTSAHIKEVSKLVEVKTIDGTDSQVVEEVTKGDALDTGREIEGMTVTGGSFEGTVKVTLPADTNLSSTAVDGTVEMALTGTAGGGAATAEIKMKMAMHRTSKPK